MCINFGLSFIGDLFPSLDDPFERKDIWSAKFAVIAYVLAPIVETILFLTLIFLIMDNIKIRYKNLLTIGLSAFLFGLMHYYNWIYILKAFLFGIALAWGYYYLKKRFNDGLATLAMIMIHAEWNILVSVYRSCFGLVGV